VFLLDHPNESPLSSTIYALENATGYARKKQHVYYLAKFIRTAGRGVETLYKEAREAGVNFIKYESLQITANEETEEYSININEANKGSESGLCILTKTIYSDNSTGISERFTHITKKLNLSTNKHGHLTEDMFFLTPALTSRRGVFHLTRDLIAERLDEGLDFIFSSISLHKSTRITKNTAEIDGKKCIFCYNCYRTCPHAALEPDKKENQMQCLQDACEGCGICVGICPACAILLNTDETGGQTPCSTLAICCENSAVDTVKSIENIESMIVPCGGVINFERLSNEINNYDEVISVICPDDACRHFDGNKRACSQTKRLREMLESAGLESKKVWVIQASHAISQALLEELK